MKYIIRELREHAGLTQTELAERSGVSRATVNRIENGKEETSTKTLEKIASALGVCVEELFASAGRLVS